jgi:NitT/TauT family transport system substrate-binding protein
LAGKSTRGRVACAAALTAVAALAGGCSATVSGSTVNSLENNLPTNFGPPEKTTLNVSVVPAMDSAGFFVARHLGLFTREGLTINYTPAISSETAVTEQLAGKLDISGGNYVSYISEAAAGKPIELVSEGSIMQPGSQVIYTMPGSKITTLKGLKGKLLGVNAPNNIDYLLDVSVLSENGISSTAVKFPTARDAAFAKMDGQIPFPTMGATLKAGAISAGTFAEPFASLAEQDDGAVPMVDLDQGATSNFPIEGYVATTSWAKQNPNTLSRFLAALSVGQEIADTDRAAVETAFETLNGPQNGQVSPEIAAVMALNTYPIGIDPLRIQRVANVMFQFGLLKTQYQVKNMLLPTSDFNFSQFSSAGL